MDDTQRIVKCGNLSLHSTGGFFKKRWHGKYLVLYDGSKSGVKRLELFDSEIKFKKQNPAKIIPLVDCVRVVTCQRHKTTYTFEVRTSDQVYLLAAQTFPDMNDWVNCLRLVAFGPSCSQQQQQVQQPQQQQQQQQQQMLLSKRPATGAVAPPGDAKPSASRAAVDVLLPATRSPGAASAERTADYVRSLQPGAVSEPAQKQPLASALGGGPRAEPAPAPSPVAPRPQLTTASQAAAAAASALAKTRQRQPSLLGSCKPQPPTDSPFIQAFEKSAGAASLSSAIGAGQLDTLTPSVRGQLLSSSKAPGGFGAAIVQSRSGPPKAGGQVSVQPTLDEEEENMLYCSIEDNPSEHNYRVKVIETELALRCQLKCYQLTASTTINQQYEQLGRLASGALQAQAAGSGELPQQVTFYQLIIGPQELTLLNDYAAAASLKQHMAMAASGGQQQGLWSWPYQCIRRYGFDKDNCFMFEAGRKCTSGPGQFIVQTPKAYQIYQDVVKFVNELRSLSSSANGPTNSLLDQSNANGLPTGANCATGQQVVTQIPVTWAPNNQQASSSPPKTAPINLDATDTRQQFFDALRQLDSTGSVNALNTTSPSKQQENVGLAKSQPNISSKSAGSKAINIQQAANKTPGAADNDSCLSSSFTSQEQAAVTKHAETKQQQQSQSQPTEEQRFDMRNLKRDSREAPSSLAPNSETDESGYEQGDDFADTSLASTPRSKLSSGALGAGQARKRPSVNTDSMSSASSTSSGGGSPAHSVGRRSGIGAAVAVFNGQAAGKRPAVLSNSGKQGQTNLIKNTNSTKTSTQLMNTNNGVASESTQKQASLKPILSTSNLQTLIGRVERITQPEDFETNLIRDVYSEITKLHAKFAVTSGSAEDLMSSNECSNSTSSENSVVDSSNNSVEQEEEEEDEEEEEEDECLINRIGKSRAGGEPMYTNLKARGKVTNQRMTKSERSFDDEMNSEEDEKIHSEEELRGISKRPGGLAQSLVKPQLPPKYIHTQHAQDQRSTHNSYAQSLNQPVFDPYLTPPRPIYPTVLNPIPECGETTNATSQADLIRDPDFKLTDGSATKQMPPKQHHQNQQQQQQQQHQAQSMARFNSQHKRDVAMNQSSEESNVRNSLSQPRQNRKLQQSVGYDQAVQKKSRLPTNHYVINDVQYAKISRNIRSKYESCL